MEDKIPCKDCIVLPMCRAYVKSDGEEVNDKRLMVLILKIKCPNLSAYTLNKRTKNSFGFDPDKIDNIVNFMDDPL